MSQPSPAPSDPTSPPIAEEDIRRLVHRFYAQVRRDDTLGPIFNARVADWDHHLEMLCDFWSSLLLGTRRFKGAPIPAHARIPDLSWPLFQRWLALFHGVTAGLGHPELQARADAMSERIATKLWDVWQHRQTLARLPDTLPEGVRPYRESPVFTPDNLPAGLRAAHTTKDGTWGLLKVHAGVLRYALDDPPHTEVVLAAGQQVVIEPGVRHHVAFELPGSFRITFCRAGDASLPAPPGA
ncbi:DUF1971 domain-containing protein [Achromobacter denitrificans]|uniref:DUF1971 domain-containing protein n=2 Tax=Achromobacter denitrificans TaxID=32002 RepID=A0A6N0JR50_ACHDE|nr:MULTISPECIES: DUF1971 domain-containing protein [Achromobacter]MBV2160865.1 DUF1971 domain-containing protein [Achromobacter denitrificans]MDX3877930.1 DUF1971 domain-containing protein [Achromobacter sp.]QCS61806.1 DUF1971 domain-containing protein [Achromobacter denitrificans]QKQ49186.1 DUF1971 domain-containing protein [Achromobacter denitrificans]WFC67131.1 DUF1971 domain-containing protein [Achromobacter denitrificans]